MLSEPVDGTVCPVKILVVHTLDVNGRPQQFRASMEDAEAEAERQRVEEEHAAAGDENRWIRFGPHSVQSKTIHAISLESPPAAPVAVGRRKSLFDMEF
jgi:hypothetical protein